MYIYYKITAIYVYKLGTKNSDPILLNTTTEKGALFFVPSYMYTYIIIARKKCGSRKKKTCI